MHFGCSSTNLDRGNSVHIFSILEDVPDQILQWNTFCSNASCNNLHHMWFNFIPVFPNERGGRYQKICALESHIIILHEVFIQNGIHPVTIKCSDTCGIIFHPRIFYGKKRPVVKCQNVIRFSGIDVTTMIWSSVVEIIFFCWLITYLICVGLNTIRSLLVD